MDLSVEQVQEITVVGLRSDHLDMGNVEAFVSAVTPVLETGTKVLFDMSQLQFVDSAGLGALMACRRQLSGVGGELTLCGMTKKVRSVFEISRMHRLFDIAETREEAINSVPPETA